MSQSPRNGRDKVLTTCSVLIISALWVIEVRTEQFLLRNANHFQVKVNTGLNGFENLIAGRKPPFLRT